MLLAQEIVARFHSQQAAEAALAEFEARFRQGVLPEDMPEVSVSAPGGSIAMPQLLKQAGLVDGTSEAMRMIQQGAVKLDGERVNDKAVLVEAGQSRRGAGRQTEICPYHGAVNTGCGGMGLLLESRPQFFCRR